MKTVFTIFVALLLCLTLSFNGQAQVVSVGSGNESIDLPIEPFYAYSYSQVIYQASDISASGFIGRLSYKFLGSTLNKSKNWEVYIGHTSKTKFDNSTDWVAVGNMEKVFDGIVVVTGDGWFGFDLDTPFEYDGTSNIVVAVHEFTPNQNGIDDNFKGSDSGVGDVSITFNDDAINPDLSAPPVANGLNSKYPNIRFELGVFPSPSNVSTGFIEGAEAVVSWEQTDRPVKWDIEYGVQGFSPTQVPAFSVTVASDTTLRALNANTAYDFYIRANNGGTDVSIWKGPYVINAQYTLTNDDVVVDGDGIIQSCSYDFANKDIVIPSTLDGQTVTGIASRSSGNGIFENQGILSLVLPATLEEIGNYAFYMNSLTHLTVPASVTNIGSYAFRNNFISTLTFEGLSALSEIGSYAFMENELESLTLPASVISIGSSAFRNNGVNSFAVTGDSELTTIGVSAFQNNSISSLSLPLSVTNIGILAFGSNPVSGITLPASTLEGFVISGWEDSNGTPYNVGEVVTDYTVSYIAQFVVATQVISLSGSLDFGEVRIGSDGEAVLTIDNTGNNVLTITSIDLPTGFTANWSSGTIAAGADQQVTITFAPSAVQSYGGDITINSDATGGVNTIGISGEGALATGVVNNDAFVKIFPVPTSSTLTVELPDGQGAKLYVYSALGNLLISETFLGSGCSIDLSVFNVGTYFITIEIAGQVLVREKIVRK